MEEKKAAVMDKVHPDLLVPPHVVGELIQFVTGEKQPDISPLEQVAAHLTECPYCRTALIVLLSASQEYERLNAPSETTLHDLLTKVAGIHLEIEALGYEQVAAYAEAIVAKGKVEADELFAVLAEHVKKCQSCEAMLEEMLDFLHETEDTN